MPLIMFVSSSFNTYVNLPKKRKEMKSINKKLIKTKLKHYKNIKREQKHDLDLKIKMPKCMANASFYRPKFGTIDLMTNCWVGGHILTWGQSLSSCLNKISLLTSEFEQIVFMKVGLRALGVETPLRA